MSSTLPLLWLMMVYQALVLTVAAEAVDMVTATMPPATTVAAVATTRASRQRRVAPRAGLRRFMSFLSATAVDGPLTCDGVQVLLALTIRAVVQARYRDGENLDRVRLAVPTPAGG